MTQATIRLDIERPDRAVVAALAALSPTTLADCLTLDAVMRLGIHPLWAGMPRVAGPAFTVRTPYHDNLMVHAAIYRAEPGDVIVVEAGDAEMAVAGGNVCAIAQRRGVAALVVDGVIRDVAEARERGFPVFARGASPIPAGRKGPGAINGPVRCGGVAVHPGDVVVADEEGIVVVPRAGAAGVLERARARGAADEALTLDEWERNHRARIEQLLKGLGLAG
jgi:regulator of RNase E activity RraA